MKFVVCGAVSGFLTGLLGVGGGFLVVPALVVVLRMPMTLAIGTSLLIIVLNAASSLVARIGDLRPGLGGRRALHRRRGHRHAARQADRRRRSPARLLTRAFAVMLVLVGLFVGAQSLLAL